MKICTCPGHKISVHTERCPGISLDRILYGEAYYVAEETRDVQSTDC